MGLRFFLFWSVILWPGWAWGQVLFDSSAISGNGRSQIEGVFAAAEIDYEVERGGVDEVERKILGVNYGVGMGATWDVVGQAGLIVDSEYEGLRDDGDGFIFGLGTRIGLHRTPNVRVIGHGAFVYQMEKYKGDGYSLDVQSYDLQVGAVISHAPTPGFSIYGGMTIVPLSDGEAKYNAGGTTKIDVERDDMVLLRLGAVVKLDAFAVRPELTLMGEQTFTLGIGSVL